MKILRLVPAVLIALCAARLAAQPTPLQRRAQQIGALISAAPSGFDTVFASSFLAQVPAARLTPLFIQLLAQTGKVLRVTPSQITGPTSGKFDLVTDKGFTIPATISIDAGAPNLVNGLLFGTPVPLAVNFAALVAEFGKLPGTVSFVAARLDTEQIIPIASLNPDTALAIGSAFKLYILGELVRSVERGERTWSDVVTLDPAAMSLPSGFLATWPAGSHVTLETLATLMISQSDNTATDQLLRALGREKVEAMLRTMDNHAAARDVPFLATLEMFKLKGSPTGTLATRYAAADVPARRALLVGETAKLTRDEIHPYADGKPSHIADVEWFASANDLARAMRWLRGASASVSGQPARKLLAVNPGIGQSKEDWPYVGYKGGSEPGVLNLTFLLQAADGRWFILSAGWNDPKAVVDESKFLGLVSRGIQLLRVP